MERFAILVSLLLVLCGCPAGTDPGDAGPNDTAASAAALQRVRACGRITGCFGYPSMRECVARVTLAAALEPSRSTRESWDTVWLVYAEAAECLAAAADCDAAFACRNRAGAQDCFVGVSDAVCQDGVWRACSGEPAPPLSLACADYGLACHGDRCVADECTSLTPVEVNCAGQTAELCLDGLLTRHDCGRLGLACAAVTANDQPAFICFEGGGAACDAQSPLACDGHQASWCHGGRRAGLDCSVFGLTCGEPDNNEPGLLGVCRLPSGEESCADGAVSFPAAHGPGSLDCRELGLSGCSATAGRAVCVQ